MPGKTSSKTATRSAKKSPAKKASAKTSVPKKSPTTKPPTKVASKRSSSRKAATTTSQSTKSRSTGSALRTSASTKSSSTASSTKPTAADLPPLPAAPKLLSGGNPQIPKGYGDAPVQAYIAAMSGGTDGWKRDLGRRLDALIHRAVPNPPAGPGLRKAVKWNSPLYGVATPSPLDEHLAAADQLNTDHDNTANNKPAAGKQTHTSPEPRTDEWFLSIHCFDKYIKVAFFRGASLHPLPPGSSKQKHVRYLDIGEDGTIRGGGKGEKLDEAQFIDWVKQASKLPGERM